MSRLAQEAARHAWDLDDAHPPSIPTSFCPAELRMLAWLAERLPLDGEIVDLGAFLGAAAVSLAIGLERAEQRGVHGEQPRIRCYDGFTATRDPYFLSLLGPDIAPSQSYFHAFVAHVPPVLRRFIDPFPGPLSEQASSDEPIALLLDNASESPSASATVVTKFLRRCRPGSFFIQRYVNFGWQPWVHLVGALARPALTRLADCGGARLWAVTGDLTTLLATDHPWEDLSSRQRIALLDDLIAEEQPYTSAMIEMSRSLTLFLDGEVDQALQALTPEGFAHYAEPFVSSQVDEMHRALRAFGSPEAFWAFQRNLRNFEP